MPPRRTRNATPKAPANRELPVVDFEELADFNESVNGCIYGDSGVGKTPFAAMAPNAVILSTEKGSISAKRFGSKAELVRAPTWDHVVAALELIDKRQASKKRLDWMIVDSVTKMQVLQIRWILERIHEEREDRDLDIPAIADHQKWQNMFKRFIDRIVDMDINVIFVATAMHKEDAEGEDLILPDIQGKDYAIANYLCAQMDFVYCLKSVTDKKTDEPFWRLLTRFRAPHFAKDRYDALPPIVNQPTMPEVINAILESGEFNAAQKAKAQTKTAEPEVEPDDWADEDDEPASKPRRNRTQTKTPAKRGKRSTAESEPEEDPYDELDEDGHDSHTKTSRRAKAKAAATRKAKVEEPAEDPDWFDPDDEDADIDFDDEE